MARFLMIKRSDMDKKFKCTSCKYFNENEGKCRDSLAPIYDENGRCTEYEEKDDQDRWIPLRERKPEIGEKVLASIVDMRHREKVYVDIAFMYENSREGTYWANQTDERAGVIAWKPLPEPYKSKELMEIFGMDPENDKK